MRNDCGKVWVKVGFFPHEARLWVKSGKVRVFTHPEEILLRLTLDKLKECHYNTIRREIASRNTIRWRLLPLIGEADSFCLPGRGGDAMFVTWELLLLFAGFIVSLLAYLDNHNKKN